MAEIDLTGPDPRPDETTVDHERRILGVPEVLPRTLLSADRRDA